MSALLGDVAEDDYGAFSGDDDLAASNDLNVTYDLNVSMASDTSNVAGIVATSVALGLLTLTTIIGNVFVIAAIVLERHLQTVSNYLIVSLAVADLLVALLVMPLGAVYEISRAWTFGAELCEMWTLSDVLCCTASILHLLAIAIDRYWAVTHVHYIQSRNLRTVGAMMVLIWAVAIVISLAPLFGWKDANFEHRVNVDKICMVSQDVSYQVFATMATFYVPLVVILLLYWRIFQTARSRLRNRLAQKARVPTASTVRRNEPGPEAGDKAEAAAQNEALLKEQEEAQAQKTPKAMSSETVAVAVMSGGKDQVQTVVLKNGGAAETTFGGDAASDETDSSTEAANANATAANGVCGASDKNHVRHKCRKAAHVDRGANINFQSQGCQTEPSPHARRVGMSASCCDSPRQPLRQLQSAGSSVWSARSLRSVRSGGGPSTASVCSRAEKKHVSLEAKRERKAAKTLAIVTGAFIVCWLPFFILALYGPIFKVNVDARLQSFLLWLGYFNSTLNPIIYTVFSPEFRQAFKRILFGKTAAQHHRPRHLQ